MAEIEKRYERLWLDNKEDSYQPSQDVMSALQQITNSYEGGISRIHRMKNPVAVKVTAVLSTNIERTINHITVSSKDPEGPSLHYNVSTESLEHLYNPPSAVSQKPSTKQSGQALHNLILSPKISTTPTIRATLPISLSEKPLFPALPSERLVDTSNLLSERGGKVPFGVDIEEKSYDVTSFEISKVTKPLGKRHFSSSPQTLAESIECLALSPGTSRTPTVRAFLSEEDAQRIARGEITAKDVSKAIERITVSYTPLKIGEMVKQTIAEAINISASELTILAERLG